MGLRSCPFCGNNINSKTNMETLRVEKIPRKKDGYGLDLEHPQTEYFVKCGRCGAKSGSVFAGYYPLTQTAISEERGLRMAIEKWDKRA